MLFRSDEMNRLGEQIANLNKEIGRIESLGQNNANDLRDKRDELEITLAKLIDFSVFKGQVSTDNTVDANMTDQGKDYYLNIGGYSFVDGVNFHPIDADAIYMLNGWQHSNGANSSVFGCSPRFLPFSLLGSPQNKHKKMVLQGFFSKGNGSI